MFQLCQRLSLLLVQMSNNFVKAIEFTLPWETGRDRSGRLRADGGYTNDTKDPGGETKWGISKRAYPKLDIKNLTIDSAFEIYKKDYYEIYSGLKTYPVVLDTLSTPLAVVIFDTGVNCGVGRTANWYNLSTKENDPLKALVGRRLEHYNSISSKNPTLQVFYKGWINRLNDLKKYCEILSTQ